MYNSNKIIISILFHLDFLRGKDYIKGVKDFVTKFFFRRCFLMKKHALILTAMLSLAL